MKYKHIIFDVDGTLIDTEQAVLLSLQDTMLELENKHYEFSELRFVLGIPGETALKQLGISDTLKSNHVWNEKLKKYFHTVSLFPGIAELIGELSTSGIRLGIITSKNQIEFKQDFIPFGLADYFDIIICVEDSERPKPFPDPMFSYLKKAGINSSDALYIGDTAYDRECASAAGADFGLALWGYKSSIPIEANYYFKTTREVLDRLVAPTPGMV